MEFANNPRMNFVRPRWGFTLIELLVVLAIIGVLLGILLPAMEHVRHQGYIDKCASNLRQIGMAISMYSNENQGNFPRRCMSPVRRSRKERESMPLIRSSRAVLSPNDLTAAVYLLLRAEHLPTEVFICPYNDATTYFADMADPQTHCNFTDWKTNLSYSFADPYPGSGGYRRRVSPDQSYSRRFSNGRGFEPRAKPPFADVTAAVPGASSRIIENANSLNHEQDGENVLYADGHVTFQETCLCGIGQDNILYQSIQPGSRKPVECHGRGSCCRRTDRWGRGIAGCAGTGIIRCDEAAGYFFRPR